MNGKANVRPEDRLKYSVTESGCWEFVGARDENNYGTMQAKRFGVIKGYAHRIAYEAWVGPIPDSMFIRHSCDNPPCINPDHLQPGTHADNMHDKVVRGRMNRHPRHAVLNETMVIEARLRRLGGERVCDIATSMNIDQTTISKALTGKNWGWVAMTDLLAAKATSKENV